MVNLTWHESDKCWHLAGPLSFATVPALLPKTVALLKSQDQCNFDLRQITSCDSAGLALIVAWRRHAQQQHCHLQLQHVPEQLCALAKVVGVAQLLHLS